MRASLVAIAFAGVAAAGETEVVVQIRQAPSIEGILLGSAPLKVETSYGVLSIPVSHLLSIDPGKGLACAQAGAARGRFDWADLVVATRYGETRVPLGDAVLVTWRRERSPPKAERYFELADGTSLGGTIGPDDFDFATAYGTLRIPLSEVRLLAHEDGGFLLRLATMTLHGEPRVKEWTVESEYGVLHVPGPGLARLSFRPIPAEGDRIEGGYVVRAVGAHGDSVYALVARDSQMTWPEAEDLAEKMGGHLATVGDDAENGFLVVSRPAGGRPRSRGSASLTRVTRGTGAGSPGSA